MNPADTIQASIEYLFNFRLTKQKFNKASKIAFPTLSDVGAFLSSYTGLGGLNYEDLLSLTIFHIN